MCVNDNMTATTCGACDDVKNGIAPFTCCDCLHPGCIFSGNKEITVCYNCNTPVGEKSGYWKNINGDDTLFCSKTCGDNYKENYPAANKSTG